MWLLSLYFAYTHTLMVRNTLMKKEPTSLYNHEL